VEESALNRENNNNNSSTYLAQATLPTPTHFSNNTKATDQLPKPTNKPTNYYAILNEIDDTEWAIADSGCSDNYFTPKAKTKNQKTSHTPVNVTLPDGTTLCSSHSCEMDVPLPKSATTGYIIPGMKSHSLILVTKLCRAGYKVLFSTHARRPKARHRQGLGRWQSLDTNLMSTARESFKFNETQPHNLWWWNELV
jgi:hypothetical protein